MPCSFPNGLIHRCSTARCVSGFRAVSLNYCDLVTVKHGGVRAVRLPLIPCSDGAGEVVEVGPGVTRVKVGDRVAGIFFQQWLAGDIRSAYFDAALGGTLDGMLADLVLLHEDGLVHFPVHMTYEEAATLHFGKIVITV